MKTGTKVAIGAGVVGGGLLAAWAMFVFGRDWAVTPTRQWGTGDLVGHVIDSAGKPVQGAKVSLPNIPYAQAWTTADGKFQFGGVPVGTVTVLAEADGGRSATKDVNIPFSFAQVSVTLKLTSTATLAVGSGKISLGAAPGKRILSGAEVVLK